MRPTSSRLFITVISPFPQKDQHEDDTDVRVEFSVVTNSGSWRLSSAWWSHLPRCRLPSGVDC